MRQITDQELLDFIDGILGADKAREVEEAIASDETVMERFEQLRKADEALGSMGVEEAAGNFSEKVMVNLHHPRYQRTAILSLLSKKNLIMLGSVLFGIIIGIYIISTGLSPAVLESVNLDSVTIRDQSLNLKPVWDTLTGGMVIKVFFLFDLLLALFLLDRAVLKPMFRGRTRAMSL